MQNKYYLKDIMTTLINKILNPWRHNIFTQNVEISIDHGCTLSLGTLFFDGKGK
jgi:hypothetical protein